jgi:serine protease inhibitor
MKRTSKKKWQHSTVKMMFSKGAKISSYADNDAQLIDIPYGNEQFRMTILLPKDNGQFGNLIGNLSEQRLSSLLNQADTTTVELEMPKFKMTWEKRLNSDLISLGMVKPFFNGAEFPFLFKEIKNDLKVGYVQHKSFIEVNEEGAEAAAATVVAIVETVSDVSKPLKIIIDRPFIFLIREKHSGAILFIGQLMDPLVSE